MAWFRVWRVLGFVAILGAFATAALAAESNTSDLDSAIESYIARNPEKLGKAIEAWLKAHPEIIRVEVEAELGRRAAAKAAEDAARRQAAEAKAREAVERNRAAIFSSRHQITVNPAGTRTLVAFTDYNCGYCRRALADLLQLMKDDASLRVVIKAGKSIRRPATPDKRKVTKATMGPRRRTA